MYHTNIKLLQDGVMVTRVTAEVYLIVNSYLI